MKKLIRDKLERIGSCLAGRLFDALRRERIGPEIHRQKKHYVDQMSRSFLVYIAISLFPVFLYFLDRFMKFLRPPELPDTALWDLFYWTPPVNLEVYGGGAILAGSLFLTRDLFDNFLEDSLEDGTILALVHSGVLFLFVGYLFSIYDYFDVSISEPGTGPFAMPRLLWMLLDNFEYIAPFVALPLLGMFMTIAHRFILQDEFKDTRQTQLNSKQWDATEQNNKQEK